MMSDSYYSKPQREEYFTDSGYYKFHEAYHLLKFPNEKADSGKSVQRISGDEEDESLEKPQVRGEVVGNDSLFL